MKRIWSLLIIIILPAAATALFVAFAFGFINAEEQRFARLSFEKEVGVVAETLDLNVKSASARIDGLAAHWDVTPTMSAQDFSDYLDTRLGLSKSEVRPVSLQWVDVKNVVRYAYPMDDPGKKIIGFDDSPYPNRMQPLEQAKRTGEAVATTPIQLVQGYPGVIIYRSLIKNGVYDGAALGVYSLQDLLQPTLRYYAGTNTEAWLRDGDKLVPLDGHAIYTTDGKRIIDPQGDAVADPDAPRIPSDAVIGKVHIADRTLDLIAVSGEAAPVGRNAGLFLFFGIGFVVSVTLFVTLLYFQRRRLLDLATRERDFVSLVSHQLRLPLTQLSWSLESVFEDVPLSEEKRASLAEMRGIVRSSVALVNDLLNISRLERGVLKMDVEEVALAPFMAETLAPLRDVAAAKGAFIDVDVPDELHACVDRIKASEALRNIVDNAIKYGPKGGKVTVSASMDGGSVRVEISDRGPGIDEATREHLFEKSTMYAKKGEGSGAGLGLYLTKQFIDRMGGSISVETSSKGTTFIITLPASGA